MIIKHQLELYLMHTIFMWCFWRTEFLADVSYGWPGRKYFNFQIYEFQANNGNFIWRFLENSIHYSWTLSIFWWRAHISTWPALTFASDWKSSHYFYKSNRYRSTVLVDATDKIKARTFLIDTIVLLLSHSNQYANGFWIWWLTFFCFPNRNGKYKCDLSLKARNIICFLKSAEVNLMSK